jgi:hypothetical protein
VSIKRSLAVILVAGMVLAMASPAFASAERWGYQGNVGDPTHAADSRQLAECGPDDVCGTGDDSHE